MMRYMITYTTHRRHEGEHDGCVAYWHTSSAQMPVNTYFVEQWESMVLTHGKVPLWGMLVKRAR